MKTFNDPIKPRSVFPKQKPVDGKNSPWDLECPDYDQRTSVFIRCGQDYDTGFNGPVGSKEAAKLFVPALPQGVDIIELPK